MDTTFDLKERLVRNFYRWKIGRIPMSRCTSDPTGSSAASAPLERDRHKHNNKQQLAQHTTPTASGDIVILRALKVLWPPDFLWHGQKDTDGNCPAWRFGAALSPLAHCPLQRNMHWTTTNKDENDFFETPFLDGRGCNQGGKEKQRRRRRRKECLED